MCIIVKEKKKIFFFFFKVELEGCVVCIIGCLGGRSSERDNTVPVSVYLLLHVWG